VLAWQNFVKSDSIVIDIGANIGYYSLVASAIAVKGSVYAFEAASQTFQLLVQNINSNRVSNVFPVRMAIYNESSEMELFISGEFNIGMTGLRKVGNKDVTIEKVQTISLDEWITTTRVKVDLIKIDIEGAELLALKGMEGILRNSRPVLFVEISSLLGLYGSSSAELYDFMRKLNYKYYQATNENTLQNVPAGTEDDLIIFVPEEYSFTQ
ncbi:MAG: FkbM family methyltransferase, partial [Flavisolibacter sp.]